MDGSTTIRLLVQKGGERLPVLLDRARQQPLFDPLVYAVSRLRGRAVNTVQQHLVGLQVLLDFCSGRRIDLAERVRTGELFSFAELDGLVSSTERHRQGGKRRSIPQRLSRQTSANRLRAIRAYLAWLTARRLHQLTNCSASMLGPGVSGELQLQPALRPHLDPGCLASRIVLLDPSHRVTGEAFAFHSRAGAVPLRMKDNRRGPRFEFGAGEGYADETAIQLLHDFVGHLWSGPREPAKIYIQEDRLDLILTMVANGTYAQVMASVEEMTAFAEHMSAEWDRAANMDF